jgi:type III secretory pathway component EscR
MAIVAFLQRSGGWLRLWIALAFIWFVATIAIVAQGFPTRESTRAELEHTEWFINMSANSKKIDDYCRQLAANDLSKLMECQEVNHFSEVVQKRWHDEEMAYATVEADLPAARIKAVAIGFTIWAGPVALLLLAGLAVRWIARGFKKSA